MNKYNPNLHHRRSIRLRGYDYSQPGAYFITLCTQNRECLFGNVVDEKMILNDAGKMIEKWYFEFQKKFSVIQCDQYIIMPNHMHFIIINVGADLGVCPENTGEHNLKGEHIGSPLRDIIRWFKTMTTNEYIRNVKNNEWKPFNGKLWQRNYYQHITRNEQELKKIGDYIINNPLKWESDKYYL